MLGTLFRMVRMALLLPFLGGIALGVYLTYRGTPEPLSYWRQLVLDRTVDQVVGNLPAAPAGTAAVVFPLAGDPGDRIAESLRASVRASGKYHVIEPGVIARLLGTGTTTPLTVADLDQAIRLAADAGAAYALMGEVQRFEDRDGQGADLEVLLRLADVQGKRSVWAREFREHFGESVWSLEYLQARLGTMHWLLRVLLWLGFVGLLPVLCLKVVRKQIARETNTARLVLWIFLSALGMVAAVLMIGAGPMGWSSGLLLCLAALTAVVYNLFVLSEVARVMR